MKTSLLIAVTGLALVLVPGCREDAESPNADLLTDFENPPGFFEDPLPGPDPLMDGENRLGIGILVEEPVTEFIQIDNEFANVFLFETSPGGPLTVSFVEDTIDRIEGLTSTRVIHAGFTFWGAGIFWSSSLDLTQWTRMYVSFKSSDAAFADITISMESGGTTTSLSAADYGFVNDGEWYNLVIPLSDFAEAGANLSDVTAPFIMGGGAGSAGESFRADNLYLTDE